MVLIDWHSHMTLEVKIEGEEKVRRWEHVKDPAFNPQLGLMNIVSMDGVLKSVVPLHRIVWMDFSDNIILNIEIPKGI